MTSAGRDQNVIDAVAVDVAGHVHRVSAKVIIRRGAVDREAVAAVERGEVEAWRGSSAGRRSRRPGRPGAPDGSARTFARVTRSPIPSPLTSPAATDARTRGVPIEPRPGITNPLEPFSDASSKAAGKTLPAVESRPKTTKCLTGHFAPAVAAADDEVVDVIAVDVTRPVILVRTGGLRPSRGRIPLMTNPCVPSSDESPIWPSGPRRRGRERPGGVAAVEDERSAGRSGRSPEADCPFARIARSGTPSWLRSPTPPPPMPARSPARRFHQSRSPSFRRAN